MVSPLNLGRRVARTDGSVGWDLLRSNWERKKWRDKALGTAQLELAVAGQRQSGATAGYGTSQEGTENAMYDG